MSQLWLFISHFGLKSKISSKAKRFNFEMHVHHEIKVFLQFIF